MPRAGHGMWLPGGLCQTWWSKSSVQAAAAAAAAVKAAGAHLSATSSPPAMQPRTPAGSSWIWSSRVFCLPSGASLPEAMLPFSLQTEGEIVFCGFVERLWSCVANHSTLPHAQTALSSPMMMICPLCTIGHSHCYSTWAAALGACSQFLTPACVDPCRKWRRRQARCRQRSGGGWCVDG